MSAGRRQRCPTSEALSRAFSEGSDHDLQAHLAQCEECRATWDAWSVLAETARALQTPALSESGREEVRSRLLEAAAALPAEEPPAVPRRRRWAYALAVAATCFAVVVGILVVHRAVSPNLEQVYRASLHPGPGAHYARLSAQPDEIVRLYDGLLTVSVSPLGPGERFRIVAGDSEVEVHGTVFDVRVVGDALDMIRVVRGEVEVRHDQQPAARVTAGERWRAPAAAEDRPTPRESSTPADVPAGPSPEALDSNAVAPSVRVATVAPEADLAEDPSEEARARPVTRHHRSDLAPSSRDETLEAAPEPEPVGPDELAFEQAWAALREGRPAEAASLFAAVPEGSVVGQDAAYWHGISLLRAERDGEAAPVLARFVARHPDSGHRGAAAVALGWVLLERGERGEAWRCFMLGVDDPDDRVRSAARRGLGLTQPDLDAPHSSGALCP